MDRRIDNYPRHHFTLFRRFEGWGVLAGDIRVGSKRGRSRLLSYVERERDCHIKYFSRFNEFAFLLLFGERTVSHPLAGRTVRTFNN